MKKQIIKCIHCDSHAEYESNETEVVCKYCGWKTPFIAVEVEPTDDKTPVVEQEEVEEEETPEHVKDIEAIIQEQTTPIITVMANVLLRVIENQNRLENLQRELRVQTSVIGGIDKNIEEALLHDNWVEEEGQPQQHEATNPDKHFVDLEEHIRTYTPPREEEIDNTLPIIVEEKKQRRIEKIATFFNRKRN